MSVQVRVGLRRMKIRDRLADFKIIDDLDDPFGAAGNLDGPILLIRGADNPCNYVHNGVKISHLSVCTHQTILGPKIP